MLTWVGKRPLGRVTAYPAQLIERYAVEGTGTAVSGPAHWSDWPTAYPTGGLLFHGDNKDVLAHLLANGFRGRVKLISAVLVDAIVTERGIVERPTAERMRALMDTTEDTRAT